MKDIHVGDKVRCRNGEPEEITNIWMKKLPEKVKVYNLSIEDCHNYYVTEKEVLVHNTCSKGNRVNIESVVESGKHSLSNVEARKWYLEQEAKIPDMIDKSLPLEEQAKQAFNLQNQFRTQARELMADRATAESLYKTDPNLTWEEIVRKQSEKGLKGNDIYKAIIESSQRSRKSVNKSLGLE